MTELTTADGQPLKRALAKAGTRAKLRAFYLVLPLLLFVVVTFVVPIGQMLHQSIHNDKFTVHKEIGTGKKTPIMVNLRAWFDDNPRGTAPDEAAYAALAADLLVLRKVKAAGAGGDAD